MKIVILDGYTENPGDLSWDIFETLGDLTVYDRTPADQTVARIGDAELVITNKTLLGADVFDACPNIKYVGVLATGYNVVDVDAAKAHGVPVCNIPTYGTQAVAQYTLALLLEVCHHIGHHSDQVLAGKWESCPDFCFWDFPLVELKDKTMGIIGFGRIGQAVAEIAVAFGLKIVAYDSFPVQTDLAEMVSLDELLAQSDIVSLHCPLFPATEGIVCKDSIAKMKDGVIILNDSRGPLIVEQDLADALNSGKVGAAALDVVSTEPIKGDNPLLKAKNCLITPHIAWAPKESRQRLMTIAEDNVKAFLAGNPTNVVNP